MRRLLTRDSFLDSETSLYIPMLLRGLSLILVIFVIPLEYLFRDVLNDHEDGIIRSIQSIESHTLNDFFKAIIASGNHFFLIFSLPILYNCIDTVLTMKICIVACHTLYFYSFMAIMSIEPRPYWIHSNIKGINCQDGYGMPSEEVLFGMVFYLYTILEIFALRKSAIKNALYTLYTLWIFLLAFADLYLGENFIHQIGMTLIFGFIILTVVLSLDPYLSKLSLMSAYYSPKNRTITIYWFISNMALLLIVITLGANVPDFNKTSIIWIKNAYKHCKFEQDVGGNYTFYQSSWIFYNTGAVAGSMIASSKLPVGWWRTSYCARGIRSIISSVVSLGIFIGFSFVKTNDKTTEYTFVYVIPQVLSGVICFGLLPLIFEKAKLNISTNRVMNMASGISLGEV